MNVNRESVSRSPQVIKGSTPDVAPTNTPPATPIPADEAEEFSFRRIISRRDALGSNLVATRPSRDEYIGGIVSYEEALAAKSGNEGKMHPLDQADIPVYNFMRPNMPSDVEVVVFNDDATLRNSEPAHHINFYPNSDSKIEI